MNKSHNTRMENHALLLREYQDDLLPRKFSSQGRIFVILLSLICTAALLVYIKQLNKGLGITAMRDFVSWGIYISNFVFFVAVSLVGSLITAILYLLKIEWRAPITRIAELIAAVSIFCAASIIIVDMGRPDRLLNILFHGRIQSPIVWDIIVVTTYMVISLLLLYFPMLPGLAMCRDNLKDVPVWQQRMYRFLALGWRGSREQFKVIEKSIRILAILIIPVALAIHTVTSWLFATTLRPGWDSTNLGPYFVAGAFVAGASAVLIAMYVFHRYFPAYKKYILAMHFDKMGKLLVLLLLIYLYFNVNEYLVPAYKMASAEAHHLADLFKGKYAVMFWLVQIGGMVIPIIILLFRKGRRPTPVFIIAVIVLVSAWFKRFLIVVPTLLHPFLPMQDVPASYMRYIPTWEEWTITIGSLAGAILLITVFARYFPVISIWDVATQRGLNLGKTANNYSNLNIEDDEK
ncbi:MAG: NrfD/PsrC family molybdoenzyme membrane anchor subunit [Bacteroidales bacterium]